MESSAQQRAKWVERWKDSGLTAQEFAAEAGLKASALYYWSAQLSAAARKRAVDAEGSAAHAVRAPATMPRIVELPVAAVATTPPMLEVHVGDARVRVPSGFDEATLTRVLRALAGAR